MHGSPVRLSRLIVKTQMALSFRVRGPAGQATVSGESESYPYPWRVREPRKASGAGRT